MHRPIFKWIVEEVTSYSSFFRDNIDCTGREGISSLLKCTSAIQQLTYDIVPEFLDKYLQMSYRTFHLALDHFCTSVMEIFRPEYLRKPTVTDVIKLYRHHKEKHMFYWEWFRCSLMDMACLLGVAGSNNNINVLHQSPLFNDLKTERASEIPFVANGVTYPWGFYLVDGIYPELATLVKTILEPADDDYKRIRYKKMKESTRKYVKRAFGVLNKKWAILANLARAIKKKE
ncbi:ALP1-like protein [Tanacetum coccineum]